MIEVGSRINWGLGIPFLVIIWAVCAIDKSWIAATGWTVILIGFDLCLMTLNHFCDKPTEGNKGEIKCQKRK